VDVDLGRSVEDAVRRRAHRLSLDAGSGSSVEARLRTDRELTVRHDYDTVDRDLERLGVTLSRLPSEAGAVWRLTLARGERVEAWEPGNEGLAVPGELAGLVGGVLDGKLLVPAAPVSDDPGAVRLRELLVTQRRALLAHEPGTRLGADAENLHQHRVAARRTRAFLRAVRRHVDVDWRRALGNGLTELGRATGPVRDLDVLLEHVRAEIAGVDPRERAAAEALVVELEQRLAAARDELLDALDSESYRLVLARLNLPPRLAEGVESIPLPLVARREFRRLVRVVDKLGKQPDESSIHGLRIALKRARYAAELAAPGGKRRKRFLGDAKELQDLLGEHQDAIVAEARLREVALESRDAGAAFIAGRLAERQSQRRERVRSILPSAWKRLRASGAGLG
jgi:CHAD domain-containing protein